MNHRTDPKMKDTRKAASHASTVHPQDTAERREKARRARRYLSEGLRGLLFGGAGFLLGGCPLWFGAAPLGLSLLAAASSYTWYILAGVLLAAVARPATPGGWALAITYLVCLMLRLGIRFFVDPPVVAGSGESGMRAYLSEVLRGFLRKLRAAVSGMGAGDTITDYYAGQASTEEQAAGNAASRREDSTRLFGEHPLFRILTAAVAGLIAGIIGVVAGGFHVYELLALPIYLLVSPLGTALLVSAFGRAGLTLLFSPTPLRDVAGDGAAPRGKALSDRDGGVGQLGARFPLLSVVGVVTLMGAVVFASRGYRLVPGSPYLGIELSTLMGLMLSLVASARLGAVPGVGMAVVSGLCADPHLSPVFILAAGGYAILHYLSHRAGVIGGCVIGGIWCGAVEGTALLATHLPAILLAAPLYFVVERLWGSLPAEEGERPVDRELEAFTTSVTAALTAQTRAEAQRARLRALSDAFGALSRRFSELSSQLKRPRLLDLRRICDEAFGKQCIRCPSRDVCWGAEYDRTLEAEAKLAARLHTGGRASLEDLPDTLQDFCPHMEAILADVNSRCAHMAEALRRSERTEVYAADYAAMATLITDALEEDRDASETMECNRAAADAIYDYLSESGVAVQGVVVCGKRDSRRQRVIVRGMGFPDTGDAEEAMRRRLGEICGVQLTPPQFEESEDGTEAMIMTLSAEAALTAGFSGSTVPAEWEPGSPLPGPLADTTPAGGYCPPAVCGDHIALFKTDNAYFYALISDGMGSGEDASLTSDICTMFLERMLAAGNRVEISLRMLDGYIRSKNAGTGDECSATVDLMELDLMDGEATFAKSGAAPTFVVRDGTVYKLRSRSMPMGILRDTPPEFLRFRMHPGDVVVMVSDGVTRGQDECPWLIDLLSSPMPTSMDALRSDIIRRALSAGSEDDLSAIAIRVEERGERA